MLATQVLQNAHAGKPATTVSVTAGQDWPDLIRLVAEIDPVTSHSLAEAAEMPRFEAVGWLERQASSGYLHRDQVTGRYTTSCAWPGRVASREPPERRRRYSALMQAADAVQQRVMDALAMTWFGLMGDHWWSGDLEARATAQSGSDLPGQNAGERR
jgi:hypothetical protein